MANPRALQSENQGTFWVFMFRNLSEALIYNFDFLKDWQKMRIKCYLILTWLRKKLNLLIDLLGLCKYFNESKRNFLVALGFNTSLKENLMYWFFQAWILHLKSKLNLRTWLVVFSFNMYLIENNLYKIYCLL